MSMAIYNSHVSHLPEGSGTSTGYTGTAFGG